jgi:uncharacterized protein (TIGR00288 family)
MLKKVRRKVKKDRKNVALFIDGPNMIRKEFDINLDKLREKVESYGRIIVAKVFLNQFASEKLIEAIANQGFEPVIALGGESQEEGKSDVDVCMAVAAMEAVHKGIDTIVLVTRDADFLPLVQKAKEYGTEVVVIGKEPGFSTALKNSADYVEVL